MNPFAAWRFALLLASTSQFFFLACASGDASIVEDDLGGGGARNSDSDEQDSGFGGAMAPVPEAEPAFSCEEETSCLEPRELEVVDGDATIAGTFKSVKDYKPGWYKMVVRETDFPTGGCDLGPFDFFCDIADVFVPGFKLTANITLTSPSGTNYDLDYYLYPGTGVVPLELCSSGPRGSSSEPGENTDGLLAVWGDDGGLDCSENGRDDTSTLLVHVTLTDGACNPNSTYTLALQGTVDGRNGFYDCSK